MVKILFFVAVILLFLILLILLMRKLYIKDLKRKGMYDDFYFKYQSVECPHSKKIKLSDVTWKDHFTMKREIGGGVQAGPVQVSASKTQHRLFCEECGEKRWFAQANSRQETFSYVFLIMKYLFFTLLGLVVLANIFVPVGIWLFKG